MQRKIEGRVAVEAVVDTDGRVARVHVTTPLDPELDARALAAAREWRFQPAQMEGRPVAIAVLLEMEFALR